MVDKTYTREQVNILIEALEAGLQNFSLDWYIHMMGKDSTPGPGDTGLAAKIHNAETILRFKQTLENQRQALLKFKDL